MATITVAYEEEVGSCSVNFVAGGNNTATRIFKVAWADVFTFVKEIYGRYTSWPEGVWETPAQFPYVDHLYCTNISVVGFGLPGESINAEGTYITYAWARVTVTYGELKYTPDEDPETVEEESISVAAEMLTLPELQYEWSGDGVAIKGDVLPGKVATTTHFAITRYHVSSLPDSTISSLVGTVNNATFRGYTQDYVLFAGADARRSITVDGAEDWELTYNFLVKNHSWNHVYRDKNGTFEAVRTKTGHDAIYEEGDFTTLGLTA